MSASGSMSASLSPRSTNYSPYTASSTSGECIRSWLLQGVIVVVFLVLAIAFKMAVQCKVKQIRVDHRQNQKTYRKNQKTYRKRQKTWRSVLKLCQVVNHKHRYYTYRLCFGELLDISFVITNM